VMAASFCYGGIGVVSPRLLCCRCDVADIGSRKGLDKEENSWVFIEFTFIEFTCL